MYKFLCSVRESKHRYFFNKQPRSQVHEECVSDNVISTFAHAHQTSKLW